MKTAADVRRERQMERMLRGQSVASQKKELAEKRAAAKERQKLERDIAWHANVVNRKNLLMEARMPMESYAALQHENDVWQHKRITEK